MSIDIMKLADPFPAEDYEWRVLSSGTKNGQPWARIAAYVTNRAIMDRLDKVVGPENWQNEFRAGPCGGVLCGISIRLTDWVTKWDGAENTDVEAVKGGLSGSMKRAGVQWGIGRSLYRLGETWAQFNVRGSHSTKIDGTWHKWDPPALPAWAVPEGTPVSAVPEGVDPATGEEDGLTDKERAEAAARENPPKKPEGTVYTVQERTEILAKLKTVQKVNKEITCLSDEESGWVDDMLAKKPKDVDYAVAAKGLAKLQPKVTEAQAGRAA